jgi:acetyltransferase-like isoleucine patch superfamily enzyme
MILGWMHSVMENAEAKHQERLYRKRYKIDRSARFYGRDIWIYGDGYLEIGPGSHINHGSYISVEKGCRVVLGKNVHLGRGVRIMTYNQREKTGNVSVGDNTNIGQNAIIMPGVKIGKNSWIGAGAVVTKDIPTNSTAVGIPAKVKR